MSVALVQTMINSLSSERNKDDNKTKSKALQGRQTGRARRGGGGGGGASPGRAAGGGGTIGDRKTSQYNGTMGDNAMARGLMNARLGGR